MRIIIIMALIFTFGCDRIAYEAKNTEAAKAVTKVYVQATRLPLDGQLELCKNSTTPTLSFFSCMENSGYIRNPAAESLRMEKITDFPSSAPHSAWLQNADAMNYLFEKSIYSPNGFYGVPYWIPAQ